ncbi:MAG: hypothetical protein HQ581_00410 [Planctomycetes bacterium]|nr:hypothetical protein [Planctomycetota bacterium]
MKRTITSMAWILGMLGALFLETMSADRLPAEEGQDYAFLTRRYDIRADLQRYAQDDPQQAIRSVIRALETGDTEYMLAHLISPAQVDEKLEGDPAAFRALAAKATPEKSKRLVAALGVHLDDGAWTIWRQGAWSHVEGAAGLSLEKVGQRWFMHNTPVPMPR